MTLCFDCLEPIETMTWLVRWRLAGRSHHYCTSCALKLDPTYYVLEEVRRPMNNVIDPRGSGDCKAPDGPASGASAAERDQGDQSTQRPGAATLLVRLAQARYEFGQTPDGKAFARRPGGHVVRYLRGGRVSLRGELAAAFLEVEGKTAPQQALADALATLEGIASRIAPTEVHLRVAEHDGVVWIDLGDVDERCIRVSAAGWQVVGTVPVLFRHTALTEPLPAPVPGGSMDQLWRLLNVAPTDQPLVLGWLVAALGAPTIPHPVLAVNGEQGTGKSSACRSLCQLIDPSSVPGRKPPRDADGWVTAAGGSWVIGIDNASAMPFWLQDSLCRAVTGEGDVRRSLYSDDDLQVFSFRRAIMLNGIDFGAVNPDLADRMLQINLQVIGERDRRSERELATEWERDRPAILGALLDQVAAMLAHAPTVNMDKCPRMADFALVLARLDRVNGTNSLTTYLNQAGALAADAVAANPFIAAMASAVGESWTGTANQLLEQVEANTIDVAKSREWPKNARAVTGLLKRNAPALRFTGWQVIELGRDSHLRAHMWQLVAPAQAEETRNDAAVAATPQNHASPAETLAALAAASGGNIGAMPQFAATDAARIRAGQRLESGNAAKAASNPGNLSLASRMWDDLAHGRNIITEEQARARAA